MNEYLQWYGDVAAWCRAGPGCEKMIAYLRNLLMALVLILLQVGCAATAYLRSDQAIKSSFDRDAAIYVNVPKAMSVEDANFMAVLEEEITSLGLKTKDSLAKADYVLSFTISESILLGQTLGYEPILVTPYLEREWPIQYYPVNVMYSYPGIKVNITLFKKANFLKPPHVPLWEAHLVIKKEVYRDHRARLIKIVLEHIGQRFEGRVKL